MKKEFPNTSDTDGFPVEVATSTFAAHGSEQRLSVLRVLLRAGPQGLSIGALGSRSGVTGSALPHHLRGQPGLGEDAHEWQSRSAICAAVAYDALQELSVLLLRNCCADCGSEPLHQGRKEGDHAVPLVDALLAHGMAPGAAMSFVIAGGVSCIPAALAVWALVKPRVFAAYLGFAVAGAVLAGIAWGQLPEPQARFSGTINRHP